jgi:hypothetical protein
VSSYLRGITLAVKLKNPKKDSAGHREKADVCQLKRIRDLNILAITITLN